MVQVAFMLLSYGLRRGELLVIRKSVITFKDNVTKIHIDKSRTRCIAPQKLDMKNLTFGVFFYEINL